MPFLLPFLAGYFAYTLSKPKLFNPKFAAGTVLLCFNVIHVMASGYFGLDCILIAWIWRVCEQKKLFNW